MMQLELDPAGDSRDGEVLIDFPRQIETVDAVRSTLITSSLASLRHRGLFERYASLQKSPHRNTILSCVAGEWLDLDVGFAHYRACDALGLTSEEQVDIGKDVSKRIQETFMRMIVSTARGAGVTPWVLLRRSNNLHTRVNRGGGLRLTRLKAGTARVELAHNPLLELAYFRNAMLGVYVAGIGLLASNVNGRVLLAESQRPGQLTVMRVDWS